MALDTAFTLFYQIGLEITPLLREEIGGVLMASPNIMDNISRAFSDMLTIVSDVTMAFYGAVSHVEQGHNQVSTKLDIYARFGHHMETFRSRVRLCTFEIWRHTLERNMKNPDQILVLQAWLAPQDTVLAMLSSDHVNLVSRPEEQTCTWMQDPLKSFLKGDEKCLLIQGTSGSGKTTLANWVVDRLQRPINRKSVETLSFFYNSSVMAWGTPLAMLKTLLFQLLSQRIGDIKVFNMIMEAYMDTSRFQSPKKQEERIWDAIQKALETIYNDPNHSLVIVIDGLDEMEGQKPEGRRVAERLQKMVHRAPGARLIMISEDLELKASTSTTTIKMMENNTDDMQTIIRQSLNRCPHFSEKNEAAQEYVVDQLVATSKGSILHASLAVRYLKSQKSVSAFDQAVDSLSKSLGTISDAVQKLVGVSQLDNDSKLLLSWLVAAERPLSREEIGMLYQAQPQQGRLSDHRVNLDSVIRSIAPFVMTGEGLVTLRHSDIKEALNGAPGSSPKERHRDLLIRLFICAKSRLHSRDEREPTLGFLEQDSIETRLASDRILEYTARYWTVHFRESSLYKAHGDLNLPQDFLSVFPNSVGFVLLEAGCWRVQSFPHETMELLKGAFQVRKSVYGIDHPTVLQSAILCAIFSESVLGRPTEAVEWYATACRIGRNVLGVQSELVINCCVTILRITESYVSKTRTDIVKYREQALTILISAYKHRFGESSDEILEIYNLLIDLYKAIGEEEKVTEIKTTIREIISITSHSHDGHEHRPAAISRHMSVTLKGGKRRSVVDGYDGYLFDYAEDKHEESWSVTRVDEIISVAVRFMSEKKYAKAEEVLLELWLRVDEQCRGTQALEWHERKIQVTLKYVEVLQAQSRREEASALLLSCWSEYSNHSVSAFESVIVLLKEVGVHMKQLGMSSISITVFQKCWSWFKSTQRTESTMFKEIEEQIAVTSREMVKESSTTSTTAVTRAHETVIRDVFESSFSTTETTEVTSTTVELSKSLTSIYMKEQKWSQAASVIKTTLMRSSFSSFFSESFESIDLKGALASEQISLVMKLAECYIHQHRYEKAESLYLRLYRVHRKACARLDDAIVIKYTDLYVNFLRQHGMTNQLISFYQELLVEYRSFYGGTHEKTISILYSLGDLCRSRSVTHSYWVDYYVEIVNNLNRGALVCQEGAFRALVIVAEHYFDSQRHSESLIYFRSIIATFCKSGTKYKYFEDVAVVEKMLEKYYKAMEGTKVETSEYLAVLKEIRQACIQFYGEESSLAINVTLHLAETCERSEKHQYEALSYYEHIVKHSKTVSKSVVERSQRTLQSLYVKQVTSSSTSKTVNKEAVETATSMSYQRYVDIRKTHVVTDQATLTQLKELVLLYHKQSKTESAVEEMRSLIIDCATKVTSSKELIETAKYMANIYVSCGYEVYARTLLHELRLQLIYKMPSKSCGFDVTSVDIRSCFSLVAALEWSLRTDISRSMASYMAELLAESMFYERFSSSIKSKSQMHVVLMHAARMRNTLYRLQRGKDFEVVEQKMVNYFISVEPEVSKYCSKNSIRTFLEVLLAHFSSHFENFTQNTMTSRAGHAAVRELRSLLRQHKYKEAVELARCTYHFLMAHEGLDDPSEISLGFQLCLLLSGRGVHTDTTQVLGNDQQTKHDRQLPSEPVLQKEVMDLSKKILGEVIQICKNHNISLVRCQWAEINDMISLLGEVKDYANLRWLLGTLWESRESQSKWGHDVMLALGTRLVQSLFLNAGKNEKERKEAIRLAEDISYNVRRVHGARHQRTLDIMSLLAELYTSSAQYYQSISSNGNSGLDKNREMARVYLKKACGVHEDALKLLLDKTDDDEASDDESMSSGSNRRGSPSNRSVSPSFLRKNSASSVTNHHHHHHEHGRRSSITRQQEVHAVETHLRLLKVAMQRLGTWARSAGEYERLTSRVWNDFGNELKNHGVKEDQVLSKKWKLDGYGNGRSEGAATEGAFAAPNAWEVAC